MCTLLGQLPPCASLSVVELSCVLVGVRLQKMERKAQQLTRLTDAVRSAETKLRLRDGIIRSFSSKLDQLMATSSSDWKEGLRELHRVFVTEMVLNGDEEEVEKSAKKVTDLWIPFGFHGWRNSISVVYVAVVMGCCHALSGAAGI
jgi:hypothetical protein